MSLKTAAILCAIALVLSTTFSIGQGVYYLATTNYYDIYNFMGNVVYSVNNVLLAIFFYIFSKRM